jgi:hypothetical protein
MSRRATAYAVLLAVSAGAHAEGGQDGFTDDFPIDDCKFSTTGGNPYFILRPGRQLIYDNDACVASGECEDTSRLQITVLNQTRDIVLVDDGVKRTVTTRVVEEKEWANGPLDRALTQLLRRVRQRADARRLLFRRGRQRL